MRLITLLTLILTFLHPCVSGARETEASQALHRLFDAAWETYLEENPTFASSIGEKMHNRRWQDLSPAALRRRHEQNKETLEQLAAIPRDKLPAQDRLNYDLFQWVYSNRVRRHEFGAYLIPLNQRSGVQTAHELVEQLTFDNPQDFEDWIARLKSIDTRLKQTTGLMRQGIAQGWVGPRVIMERIPDQLDAQSVATAEESPFYAPFKEMPAHFDEDEKMRLRREAAAAIDDVVIPSFRRFQEFFVQDYIPASRDTVGIWDVPGGREYYQHRVEYFTTTDMSADEIHELGLAEVKRIRGEMLKIIDGLGFEGSFADFLQFLRTDKQFYFEDPEDLLTAYLAASKRIDPELVKLFGRLPRTPYGVRPIPSISAPDTTTAYYSPPATDGSRAGYYYVNLYKPEVRPKYEIEVLTVHEAMPGHHLQIALAREMGEMPEFRRFSGFTAFVEGWALYSESLGEELGLYKDPYSKFGQLTYEMWRAVRLVVDTGIHHQRWSRQQAIEFFKTNAAKTEHDIINEIDRYIAWPGQALAYKIGELRIKELRRKSEQALGEKFDVKAFHDTVLGAGAIPLDVLERNVLAWIKQQ